MPTILPARTPQPERAPSFRGAASIVAQIVGAVVFVLALGIVWQVVIRSEEPAFVLLNASEPVTAGDVTLSFFKGQPGVTLATPKGTTSKYDDMHDAIQDSLVVAQNYGADAVMVVTDTPELWPSELPLEDIRTYRQ